MSTPLQSLPEWDPASVDGPGQTSAALRAVEKKLNLTFASATARGAAITAPVNGMRVLLTDTGDVTEYLDGVWNVTHNLGQPGISRLGAGSGITGTPPEGGRILRQSGTQVTTTGPGGGLIVVFPEPFPNGLLSCGAISGDDAAFPGWFTRFSANAAQAIFNARTAAGTFNSSLVRIDWWAEGW